MVTNFVSFESIGDLTLCIQETPKRVLVQTVKTLMKCRIMGHFIRVYIVKVEKIS